MTNNKSKDSLYEEAQSKLANRLLKESEPKPIQEVKPVRENKKEKQTQLGIWIDEDLMQALWLHKATTRMSIKEIVAHALKLYLQKEESKY